MPHLDGIVPVGLPLPVGECRISSMEDEEVDHVRGWIGGYRHGALNRTIDVLDILYGMQNRTMQCGRSALAVNGL